jgi:Sec-independent protein translocase protein TatA
VRLDLDKLVARRKTEVKEEAIATARRALDAHIAALNAELAPMRLPTVVADFAGAIKGLKSFASMQDKIDGTLAVAKIAADADARGMRSNLATFKAAAEGFEFLFADLGQIVHKAADDFTAVVQARIAAHKAAEDEKKRKADEAAKAAAAAVSQVVSAPASAPMAKAVAAPVSAPASAPSPAPRADEPTTLKLGVICERLGITMTAAFVADTLGIKPARVEGAAKLYRESDFGRICAALQQHIEQVYAAQREQVAA